ARTPNGACFAVARELGIELVEGDPVAQVGHALAGRGRALFVLDNLEQLVDHAAACVGAWAAAAPEASFLATSRVTLRIEGEHQVTLEGLGRADACALFHARVGRALDPREQQDLERLVDELDGLPLAIELAAARSRTRMVDAAHDLLQDDGSRRPPRHQSLTASLDATWALLTPWASGTAAQLTVFEGGARLEAAEAIARAAPGTPDGLSVVDALQELLDANLVRWEPATERFVMSPLVAAHARTRAVAGELEAAEVRHGGYFAQLGSPAALRALDRRGGTERWRALVREVDNLTAALRRAIGRDDGETAAGCALALDVVLSSHGPVQAAVEVLEDALELGPRRAELRVALGRALTETDRFAEADRVLGLALADAADPRQRAAALHARGVLELQTERVADAERTLSAAAELYHAAGDTAGQAMVLRDLGVATWHLGRVDQAVGRFEQALRLAREARSRRAEALVTANLALVHTDTGDLEQALAFHHRALAVLPKLGARRAEAKSMANLALTLKQAGRLTESIEWGERAVGLIRTTGDRRARAAMLSNLGNSLASLGRLEAAVAAFDDAIELHRALGDRRFEGITLGNLAAARLEQGRDAEAQGLLERALSLHRAVGNRLFEAFALGTLGVAWGRAGRHSDAAAAFDAAAVLAEVARDRVQHGLWTTWGALTAAQRGDRDGARAALSQAEPALAERGSRPMMLETWVVRARTAAALGESPAAAVDRALALAAELGLDRSAPALAQLPGPA
ncbi:MAG: tetratricopeptide repeat protein, partial [Myxococcota bacterium]